MNIRFLETAVCLANCKNFRLTAERLHITQAAISSRIAVLEEEFGQRLFERDAKHVKLTPAGEKFVAAAAEVLASYATLESLMKQKDELKGVIRIGAVSSMAHFLLPALIARIRRLHPAVALEVLTDDTGQSFQDLLAKGEVDFCLTALPEQVAVGIEVEELCTVDMTWVASDKMLPPSDTPRSVQELARLPIITYAPGSVNGQRIKAYFKDTGVDHRSFMSSSSLSALVHMAGEGLGLAVIPDFIANREVRVREGSLHKLNLEVPYPPTTYCTMRSRLRSKRDITILSGLCVEICEELCRQSGSIKPCPRPHTGSAAEP
jgi:DNA-binding transcriptional LysR family regulator